MVRTQIQLTEEQARRLKAMAAAERVSVAELIRRAIDLMPGANGAGRDAERERRALAVAGRFSSGLSDVSVNHDRYLAEIYAERGE